VVDGQRLNGIREALGGDWIPFTVSRLSTRSRAEPRANDLARAGLLVKLREHG
jgi:hypothetical protein